MSDGRFKPDADTRERARRAGRASAEARRRRKREQLTLESVEAAFGPLETLEDAQKRLERLGVWAARLDCCPEALQGRSCEASKSGSRLTTRS